MSQNRFGPSPSYGTSYGSSQADESSDTQWMDYENFEEGGTSVVGTDLSQSDRAVHVNFFNDFDDIFDDENLD